MTMISITAMITKHSTNTAPTDPPITPPTLTAGCCNLHRYENERILIIMMFMHCYISTEALMEKKGDTKIVPNLFVMLKEGEVLKKMVR